jgi:hypothetical protein
MGRAVRMVPPELAAAAAQHPIVADALASDTRELWRNDRYVVHVSRREDGSVECLSIRRDDRRPADDWRHKQQIKNEIAGEDVEGFEIYPRRDRTMDTANQAWIWCLPPGAVIPAGFQERTVSDEEDPRFPTSKQRPMEEGLTI